MGLIDFLKYPLHLYRKAYSKGVYSPWDDPERSYMLDPKHQSLLIEEIAGEMQVFSNAKFGTKLSLAEAATIVENFLDVYRNKPFLDNQGGSPFTNALAVFFSIRVLKPKVIVESGVWKGMTTYLMHKANPDAKIHCFDLSFGKLEYRCPMAEYHEHDWGKYEFTEEISADDVAFFDCHVDHSLRILEAHKKGFRKLIVDDNPPLHKLYSFGLPPFPTADMILNEDLKDGEKIRWVWNTKNKEYTVDGKRFNEAKSLLLSSDAFPEVSSTSRYGVKRGTHSFLSYVTLSS